MRGTRKFTFAFFVELVIDDLLAIEFDLQVRTLAGDDHTVPFTRFPGHVLGRPDGAYDAAVVMVTHLVVRLSGGIENLTLNARLDWILWVPDTEEHATVTSLWILVLHLEDEVLVFLFGNQVGIVSLPTSFSLAGLNEQGAIFLGEPVPSGVPVREILAVEQADETILTFFVMFSQNGKGQQSCPDEAENDFLHNWSGLGGLFLFFDDANLDVAPSYAVGTASFSDSVNLQTDESLGVRLQLFLVHEIGYLFAIDPSLDAGSLGEHTVLVPFAILEVLVRLELVLWGHPSAAGFSVYVSGLGSFSFGCLNLDLWAIDPAKLVSSLLFLVVQWLGLRANLHARVELVVDQLDFEQELEIPIKLVRAKEGIRATLICRTKDCPVLDDVAGGSVLLDPALEGFAVKDGNEFLGVVVGVSVRTDHYSQGGGENTVLLHAMF